MTFAKYDTMKDSGVKWIDKIPKDWNIQKIKHLVLHHRKVTYGIVQPGKFDKNGILLIRGRDYISGWGAKGDFFKVSKELHQQFIRAKVISGDILMCIVGATTGKVNQIPDGIKEANITQTTARISCNQTKMLPKFMQYSLDSSLGKIQVANYVKGSAQPGLNLKMVENFVVCMPKLKEQKQIVDYLDIKTKEIDHEISKNQKLIKLLQEQRQSTINHVVTKGLDDLVPMKDSGVDWIGEIPEHWNLSKYSHVSIRITYGFTNPMPSSDNGPWLLTTRDIKSGKINYNTSGKTDNDSYRFKLSAKSKPEINTVLITKDGTLGQTAILDSTPLCINQSIASILPNSAIIPKFLQFSLSTNYINHCILSFSDVTTIPHISITDLGKWKICLPSLKEQKQIVDYLDIKTKKIDSLISNVDSQIEKLHKFRESLISSTVIGKICVSN